jgi:hypothetical protein
MVMIMTVKETTKMTKKMKIILQSKQMMVRNKDHDIDNKEKKE